MAVKRVGKTLPNGIDTTYSYDAANQLTNLVNKNASGSVVSSFAYSYDKAGNQTSVTEAGGSKTSYGYNALDELTKAQGNGQTSTDPVATDLVASLDQAPDYTSYLNKVENALSLLNDRSQEADLSLAPQLPSNPLNGVVKPNLNTNLAQVIAVYNGQTGALDADYSYGLERLAVHDEDTSTGKVQDPPLLPVRRYGEGI